MQEKSNLDTFSQMYEFFLRKIDELINANIDKNKIIIDCGFGFFDNNADNITILSQLANLQALNCPILLGISRKSFINDLNIFSDQDNASMLISSKYIQDINILRVHDVKTHKEMLNLYKTLKI